MVVSSRLSLSEYDGNSFNLQCDHVHRAWTLRDALMPCAEDSTRAHHGGAAKQPSRPLGCCTTQALHVPVCAPRYN
eukprot:5570560-Pleurochrysis_carterae.AAC.1